MVKLLSGAVGAASSPHYTNLESKWTVKVGKMGVEIGQ
jgi:hypothetical protein